MADQKTANAASKITRFYVDQVERSAPKLKNAVEDWHRVYNGFLDASFKAQKSVLKTMGIETKFVEQVEEMVKSTTKTALKMQKEFSDASIDISLKAVKSLLDKTEKA